MKSCKSNLWKFITSIAILLTTGCSAKNITLVTNTPGYKPTITLNGKIAFVSSRKGKFDIFVMNVNGSDQRDLTNNLSLSYQPAWSPDGRYLAFTSSINGTYQIYTMLADGSEQKQLTHEIGGSYASAWSPDGKNIIFLSDRDEVLSDKGVPISEVYIMRADGSEQRRLTNNKDWERTLSWSPNGNVLAVSSNILTPSGIYSPEEIYLMGLNGRIQKQLTDFSYVNEGPKWSPNGDFLAFASYGNGDSKICTMKSDGSDQVCLIKTSNTNSSLLYVNNLDPSWSPDGNSILFSSNRDGQYHIYIMNTDGSGLIRLTDEQGDEKSPVWSLQP